MRRSASVRFDGVLAAAQRDTATRTLRSAGATATSWHTAAGKTYAALTLEPHATTGALAQALGEGRVDAPSLAVLRITPVLGDRLPVLAAALGGPGRPRGVVDLRPDGRALVLDLAPQVTTLAFVMALIDVELARFPGRTLEPLLPLDDATLAAFAGDILGEPDLDAGRLIETYLEPLLAAGAPGGSS